MVRLVVTIQTMREIIPIPSRLIQLVEIKVMKIDSRTSWHIDGQERIKIVYSICKSQYMAYGFRVVGYRRP